MSEKRLRAPRGARAAPEERVIGSLSEHQMGRARAIEDAGRPGNRASSRGSARANGDAVTRDVGVGGVDVGRASDGVACGDCGATATSRWRRAVARAGETVVVCKACFQKRTRRKNAMGGANGRRCVTCASDVSRGDWVRAKTSAFGLEKEAGFWCARCYERHRREKRKREGEELPCPKCASSRKGMLFYTNPDASTAEAFPKVCVLCYQRFKYQARLAARACELCGASNVHKAKWRRLPRDRLPAVDGVHDEDDMSSSRRPPLPWVCLTCYNTPTRPRVEPTEAPIPAKGARKYVPLTPTVHMCGLCGVEKSSRQWRKVNDEVACSACYQQAWRRNPRRKSANFISGGNPTQGWT